MENKTMGIGLVALIIGLLGGYAFGVNAMPGGFMGYRSGHMYEEIEEHMYGDELINQDGAMMHAMDEMMLGFRGKSGVEFEEAFLRGMIVHHIGAIEMAEELLEQTERPELVEMANNIISAQSEEVEMMKGWLNEWYGN